MMFTDDSEGYSVFSTEDGRCLPTCLARPASNSIYERVLLQMIVAQLDKKLPLSIVCVLLGISPASDVLFLIAQDDGTDIEFRNVDFYTSDAGEIPKRTQTTF